MSKKTHLADGTLDPAHLRKQMCLIFPEKNLPDFDTLAEADPLLAKELELDGYLTHLGPPQPGVREWDCLIASDVAAYEQDLLQAECTDPEDIPPDEDSTSQLFFLLKKFSQDCDSSLPKTMDSCHCIGRSSKLCPLNIHTSSRRLNAKQVATRGAVLCCSGC